MIEYNDEETRHLPYPSITNNNIIFPRKHLNFPMIIFYEFVLFALLSRSHTKHRRNDDEDDQWPYLSHVATDQLLSYI